MNKLKTNYNKNNLMNYSILEPTFFIHINGLKTIKIKIKE